MIQTRTNIDNAFITVLINLQPTHNRGMRRKFLIVCFLTNPHRHANLVFLLLLEKKEHRSKQIEKIRILQFTYQGRQGL